MGYPYSAQPVLVSGANIKTIGGESVLGSGDIDAVSSADLQAALADMLVAGTGINVVWNGANEQWTISSTVVGTTNLSIANRGTTTLDVASDTGSDATIPAATTSLAGLMASADKTKLDGIATGARIDDFLSSLAASEISITGTATATIGRMHVCSGTSSNYTVTLPEASGNSGKFIAFRMSSALTRLVTIDGNSTELIDGQQTRIMWANETALLFCDGTGWTKIAGKSIPMQCRIGQTNPSFGPTSQAIPTGTVTVIQVNTTDRDNTGFMSDLANDRINCVRGSFYRISGCITYNSVPDVGNIQCRLHKNGVNFVSDSRRAIAGDYPSPSCSATISLDVNDYVDLRSFHNAGTNVNGYQENTVNTIVLEAVEVPSW